MPDDASPGYTALRVCFVNTRTHEEITVPAPLDWEPLEAANRGGDWSSPEDGFTGYTEEYVRSFLL